MPPSSRRGAGGREFEALFGQGEGFSDFLRSMLGEQSAHEFHSRARPPRQRRGGDVDTELPIGLALGDVALAFDLPGTTDCPT